MLIPGVEVQTSAGRGRGLFSTGAIPRGQVVWHPCPRCEVVSPEQRRCLSVADRHRVEELGYRLSDGCDLVPCRNACLMNHSCEPSTLDAGLEFGIAVRDIRPGDELTLDYRTFCADPAWSFTCRCGAAGCSGRVASVASPPRALAARWRRRLAAALPDVARVAQPLEAELAPWSALYRHLRRTGTLCADHRGSILAPAFHRAHSS